ncbi:MAG TPA: hypothetical protein VK835_13215 [Bacteroidia bacterium]|nr:hypothetical protein [Bacteroidia bacterium]
MKKVAVILFLSLVSLGNANAMNGEHGGRGGYRGEGHQNYHREFNRGYYGNNGYRGGYYRGGCGAGYYGAAVYVPIWVPGYWIYDNYGNQIQWINGYYR